MTSTALDGVQMHGGETGFSDLDRAYMSHAISIAKKASDVASPNPMVGAVLVRDGQVVGEGFHCGPGTDHAEVVAIRNADGPLHDAVLYVTLEPCNHFGRTPPCTTAILDAGIRRVVYACDDPLDHGAGSGAAYLRSSGLVVQSGLMEEQAAYENRFFLQSVRNGRPWVVAKFASSLDGRIATRSGDSRWITGEASRRRAHELRRIVDAVLVGSGTVLLDDPELSVRNGVECRRPPRRIVLDARGRVDAEAKVFGPARGGPVIVATTDRSNPDWRGTIRGVGAEILMLAGHPHGGIDLHELLDELMRSGVRSLMVEGGATLLGSFFDSGIVDEVWAFLSMSVIGGRDAPAAVGGIGPEKLSSATALVRTRSELLGSDILVRGLTASKRQEAHVYRHN